MFHWGKWKKRMGANSSSKRPVFDEKEDGEFVSSPLFCPSSPLYAEVSPNCSLFPINWNMLTYNLFWGGGRFGGFLCLIVCSNEFGLL